MELIRELHVGGATIIMITHDRAIADQLPRRIRMLDGRVVSDTGCDRAARAPSTDGADAKRAVP
jgi:putative ABC transport system ATP-binding protein